VYLEGVYRFDDNDTSTNERYNYRQIYRVTSKRYSRHSRGPVAEGVVTRYDIIHPRCIVVVVLIYILTRVAARAIDRGVREGFNPSVTTNIFQINMTV